MLVFVAQGFLLTLEPFTPFEIFLGVGKYRFLFDVYWIALVENMLDGLNVVSVDSTGKLTTTWGNIKSDN